MKKSTILMISILIGLLGISFAVRDALALDAPHNTNDSTWSITCSRCHYSATSVPTWATLPTGTDTTFKNNLCTDCHSGNTLSSSRFNDVKTHSAGNTGSSYWGGNWTVECVVCHNPHAQPQVAVADPDVNILTGTVGTVTSTYGAVSSSLTTTTVSLAADYTDYLLIPNIAYPTRIYRIASNTANSITVTGAINTNYTGAGKTFAIRYGKMVPTALSYPSKGISASVKFFNKTGADSFAAPGAASTAICQVCHTQTTSFKNTGTQEAGAHPAGVAGVQACTDCHAHSSGFKIGGCTGCHGSPPSSSANLVFLSRTSTSVTSDSPGAGAHVKHTSAGFDCATCHTGGMLGGANQGDDKINLRFTLNSTDITGTYDGKSGRTVYPYLGGGLTAVTTGNTLQCSNLYCHSTVQAANGGAGAPTYRTPTWTGTAVCGSCHNADGVQGNATLMSTGSHTKHLSASVGANCDTCHSGATHVNRNIEVTNSYTAGGAPGNGFGSCSAATCHMSPYATTMIATPVWGAAGGCNACHSSNPIQAYGPNTGSHAKHNITVCTNCHNAGTTSATAPSTGHIDGNIDVTGGYPADLAKHAPGSYTGTCSSASCHQSGISVNAYVTTPVWSTSAPNCSVCHAAVPATGAHSVHVNASAYDCSQCHTGAIKDTSYASAQHRDLNIDVSVGGYTANKALGSAPLACAATCHGTSSPLWNNTASVKGDCSLCHGMAANPADGRDTAFNTSPSGSRVGAHVAHLTGVSNYSSAVSCTACHTVPAGAAYIDKVKAAGHIDGDNRAEVLFSGLSVSNGAAASYNQGTGTCSTTYCHGGKMINLSTTGTDTAPEWNQIGYLTSTPAKVGDCNKCHGAPPTGYAGSSHSGSETLAQCNGCHGHVNTDGSFNNKALHMDGLVQATGCTGCHGQPPIDAATMVVNPAATGRATLFASSNGGAGAHAFHVTTKNYSCSFCHSGGGGSGHQTSTKMTFGFTYGLSKGSYTAPALSNGFTFTVGSAGTTVATSGTTRNCSNYCHSSGQAANGGAGDPVWAVANWDNTASGACGACHATSGMATGSHTKHLAQSTNCGNCHTGAALASYASTSHVNQLIDVATGLSYTGGGAPGNNYATCQNASCHDTGRNVVVATPLWGTTISDCSTCHAKQPATGSHTKHLTGTAYHKAVCGDCHGNAVEGTTALATHPTGTVDVYDVTAGDLGYPAVAKHNNNTFQSCNAAYCHSSGQAANGGTTPLYSAVTWSTGSLGCGSCHKNMKTDPAAPGSHVGHAQTAAIACGNCHSGYTETTANLASHVDRLIFTSFSGTAAGTTYSQASTSAVGNGYGTCSATTCHGSSAVVTWGTNTNNGMDTCTKCHGTPTATVTAANRYVVAPPKNLAGGSGTATGVGLVSNDAKVGAHQTHLRLYNGLTSSAIQTFDQLCVNCHGTLPTLGMHANGSSAPTFTGMATKNGAMSPGTYTGTSCNNTYCHNPAASGGTLLAVNTGSSVTPSWTNAAYLGDTRKTQANCGVCHKSPGDAGFEPAATHSGMTVAATTCTGCHGHDGDSQGIAGQRHMDGFKYGGGNCDSCHAYDVVGATYTAGIWSGGTWTHSTARDGIGQGWGAHVKHINHIKTRLSIATVLNPVSQTFGVGTPASVCGTCHTNTGAHDTGGNLTGRLINFGDGSTTYQFGASAPVYNGASGTSSSVNPKTCSNVSCHFKTTPAWSAY